MRWRSMLFVPANRPELAVKAARSGADVIVLDLEDAVPPAAKPAARSTLADAVASVAGTVDVCVRVNPPATGLFDDDLAALPEGLAGVVVPKWERPIALDLPTIAGLETVAGVAALARSDRPLPSPVIACYFGAEDYIADLGGERTPSNAEVHHARAAVAVGARLSGVVALDMITLALVDHERFGREAAEARALGYGGKLCIHPSQVALANAGFTPADEDVQRARRLLAAFEDAGGATISFEGVMVDEVVAVQARNLVRRAEP
jgi:citrate lyase subunit beta / citryl-CoA lyase